MKRSKQNSQRKKQNKLGPSSQLNVIKSRKELRKEKRKEKKAKKHDYFTQKKCPEKVNQLQHNWKETGQEEVGLVPLHVKKKNDASCVNKKRNVIEEQIHHRKLQKEKMQKKLKEDMQHRRIQQLKQANEQEDRIIKKLEKQLKLNKRQRKSVPKSFSTDGLDYLLEVCDQENLQELIETEQNLHESGSEFEEDFATVTGRSKTKQSPLLKKTKIKKCSLRSVAEKVGDKGGSQVEDTIRKGGEMFSGSEDENNLSGESSVEWDIDSESSQHKQLHLLKQTNLEKSSPSYSESDSEKEESEVEDMMISEYGEGVSGSEDLHDENDTDWDMGNESLESNQNKNQNMLHSNKPAITNTKEQKLVSSVESNSKTENRLLKHKKASNISKTKVRSETDNVSVSEKPLCKNKYSVAQDKRDSNFANKIKKGPLESKINPCVDVGEEDRNTEAKRRCKKSVTFNDEVEVDCSDTSDEDGFDDTDQKDQEMEVLSGEEDDNILESSGDEEQKTSFKSQTKGKKQQGEHWEDLYGRIRDKKGNVVKPMPGKYVPPQLRAAAIGNSAKKQEQLQRLRKQLKGLLNRLAENNMGNIATQLDLLYMNHSRNDMNETLTQLLLDSMVASILTPERLVMEHTMLVAILHANVGTEVGAHFLQRVVKQFSDLYENKHEAETKELDNLLLIISHLYNFKVVNSLLMYDILEKLTHNFGEKEVELILLVLKTVGFSLRKDDPLALKDLIVRLQEKAGGATTLRDNSRVRFMLDILLAIKNNNMTKIPNYDISYSEHLKKLVKAFLRKGNYVTELKITFEDLLKADERGRWWVVGSAWCGPVPGEAPSDNAVTQPTAGANYSVKLLELARKQRMNTDARRNIFCILMTAEDYLDAFEKLLHLDLKNQQEREIIYVILDCCLHEKEFNPYYGHLAQKFCEFDRKYLMTYQYSLWDKLKELANMTPEQMANLAKLTIHMLLAKVLPLSALKVVQFAEVDRLTVRFLRQVLLGLLLCDSDDTCCEVFQRSARSSNLRLFREGLRLFLHHFVLRNTTVLSSTDMDLLRQRVIVADKVLTATEGYTAF